MLQEIIVQLDYRVDNSILDIKKPLEIRGCDTHTNSSQWGLRYAHKFPSQYVVVIRTQTLSQNEGKLKVIKKTLSRNNTLEKSRQSVFYQISKKTLNYF